MGVQSPFDAIAVQPVTLLAMHVKGAKNCAKNSRCNPGVGWGGWVAGGECGAFSTSVSRPVFHR